MGREYSWYPAIHRWCILDFAHGNSLAGLVGNVWKLEDCSSIVLSVAWAVIFCCHSGEATTTIRSIRSFGHVFVFILALTPPAKTNAQILISPSLFALFPLTTEKHIVFLPRLKSTPRASTFWLLTIQLYPLLSWRKYQKCRIIFQIRFLKAIMAIKAMHTIPYRTTGWL